MKDCSSPWTRRSFLAATLASFLPGKLAASNQAATVFQHRGYYLCFMRMPTFGLKVWREILDAVAEDGGNTVVLWMAGAFRSRKFPITWQWASDHANVKRDFGRDLIRHAHRRGIRILLGFTPFGYDGTNQVPLEKPHLKATGADGKPVASFGIGCWGWNLCPAQPESQAFMRDYIREMAFEFYPEADGLFIESSDYGICQCSRCGPRFFEQEFAFVREISNEVWNRRSEATVVVYPHYFSGARLRFAFAEATAAKQPFDPRWTLFFTPHSAALEPSLIARARSAWWWNEAPCRFDIANVRAGAQKARDSRCGGYLPSLECYSYVVSQTEFGEPWLVGKRQVPFGFGWLKEGENPYRTLPLRAIRLVYRELTGNPDLPDPELQARLGRRLFGAAWNRTHIEDLLTLFRIFNTDRDWSVPGALTTPGLVKDRADHGRLDAQRRATLRGQLAEVQSMAQRHRNPSRAEARELGRIAQWLVDQWPPEAQRILVG
ncbi:MAG: hypothetical protein JNK85_20265 [Verrucomicrobiales bacterium]|nr:hypothetical protein [Verrucomicrobiales bacterium]